MKIFFKTSFWILFGSSLCLIGCNKSEITLQPSDVEEAYSLRSTGKPYDQDIADFNKRFGTFIYYQFSDKEAYWTPTGYKSPVRNPNGVWVAGFEVRPTNSDSIADQLDMIKDLLFDFYSDNYLKDFLPKRILLCQQIDSVSTGFDFSTNPFTYIKQTKSVPSWTAFDQLSISVGVSSNTQMTPKELRYFMGYIHLKFLQNMVENRRLKPTTAFSDIANYNVRNTTQQNAYDKGIITVYYNSPTAITDWAMFMEAMLTRSLKKLQSSTSNTDQTLNGILNNVKDKNGLIRKRYDIVRSYYINNYGVDLQAIGDVVNP